MGVINIQTKTEFEDVAKSNNLVVVHFYADWATQCETMNEVLEELAKQPELNGVKFAKCPAEDVPEVSMKYDVSSVPTCLLLNGDILLDRVDGAKAAELTKKVNQLVSSQPLSPPKVEEQSSKEELNTRLRRLITDAPVMLFMKGTPEEPRCGFSKTIVGILDKHNAKYKSFNILADEEVRQGLKTFSNWPTYPQLYINGELIGGLDIIKEMEESGELAGLLPKKVDANRLKQLITRSPCMVFMKGDRFVPQCGFSKQLVDILTEMRIDYDTYDILKDEDVRQGLKEFSKWPTYPQVYVKGELIGGLDIIKELKANGELEATLKC
ncbi:glutaredoxin 3 isoform X1 [Schistocerca nitens]|uniref:glutaredoxin 3 isoform X1 n=1 Tax=Schistocerca nitens TaxID=7011 RepID=UPI0021184154|nr:glutaredoxin 3 isoform X1 [Schistocerca nitens]